MTQTTELVQKVQEWAEARNLIKGSTPVKQCVKLFEEFGELARGVAKQDPLLTKDSIGDTAVVCIILLAQLGKKDIPLPPPYWTAPAEGVKHHKEYAVMHLCEEIGRASFWLNRAAGKTDHALGAVMAILDGLCTVARVCDTTIDECLALAYNEIKDRKGKMVDGVFIKEE